LIEEIIMAYFNFSYWVFGRLLYGEKFELQKRVPFLIKLMSIFIPIILFAVFMYLLILISNS